MIYGCKQFLKIMFSPTNICKQNRLYIKAVENYQHTQFHFIQFCCGIPTFSWCFFWLSIPLILINLYFPFSEFPNCSGKATNVCLVHFSPWVETLSMDYYFMWVFLNFYLLSFWDSSGWFDLVMALILWLLFLLFPRYFLYLFCHLQSSGCSL